MVRLNIITFIFLFLISCKENPSIHGNWYSFDSDSNYTEANFEGNLCKYYNDKLNGIIEQNFQLINDTVYFYEPNGNLVKTYCPSISWINNETFKLEYEGDIQIFRKIPEYEYTLNLIEDRKWFNYYKLAFQLRKFKYSDGKTEILITPDN